MRATSIRIRGNITRVVSIRLQDITYREITRLINESQKQPAESVGDYCKREIERFVWRHKTLKKGVSNHPLGGD